MSKDKCSKEGQVSGVKKLRELIKRNKTAVVVVVALAFALILTPIIISTYSPLVSSEISADGLLSYIGALLGAAATICAVRITIFNERNRQEEDRIISAKPWLASETLMLCSNEDIQEEENGMTTCYFSLKINYSSRSMDRYISSRSLIYPANSFSIAEGSRFMWYESKAS